MTVSALGDRDTDGVPDAAYHVGFKRPSAGTYRVRAVYGGSAELMPWGKIVTFTL